MMARQSDDCVAVTSGAALRFAPSFGSEFLLRLISDVEIERIRSVAGGTFRFFCIVNL